MNKITEQLYRFIPIITSALALAVCIIIFSTNHISPFGDKTLLISDLGSQYLPFLTDLKNQIETHTFSFYSLKLSIGDNYFPLFAYYLISPFNLLLFFASNDALPTTISIIIMLKIVAISLTTSLFVRKLISTFAPKKEQLRKWLLLFGIPMLALSFSLGGFVALYFYNLMWLDSLICLPLVGIGLIKIIVERKPATYFVALTITIITNYYLGFMTCIFSVLLFIYLLLYYYMQTNIPLKQAKKSIVEFMVTSILSGLTSSVVLIPTILGMLKTDKGEFSNPLGDFHVLFDFSIFKQLSPGANSYVDRLEHLPSIFTSTLVIVMVFTFFFLPNIKRQIKWLTAGFIGLMFLSIWWTPLYTVWHMFNIPAGFPYRNVYFFQFTLIVVATLSLINFDYSWQAFKRGVISTLCILAIGLYHNPTPYFMIIAILITLAITVFIYTGFINHEAFLILLPMICILSLVESGLNLYGSMLGIPYGSQKEYSKVYTEISDVIPQTKQLNRLHFNNNDIQIAYNEQYNSYNNSFLFDYDGVDAYSSTLNFKTQNMLESLGLFSRNARRISFRGHTNFVRDFLHVNVNYTEDNKIETEPNIFPAIYETKTRNPLIDLPENRPIGTQTRIMNNIFGTKNVEYFNAPTVKENSDGSLTLTMNTSGSLYLYLPNHSTNPNYFLDDGERHDTVDESSYLINLGYLKKGAQKKIEFANERKKSYPYTFTQFNNHNYKKYSASIRKQTGKVYRNGNDSHIVADITTKNNKTSVLSIPYDEGFSVLDNGKAIKPFRVYGNMTGLNLKPGKHHITLTYMPQGLYLGLFISMISLVSFILFDIIYHKKTADHN